MLSNNRLCLRAAAQYVLLFVVLAVNSALFGILRSYTFLMSQRQLPAQLRKLPSSRKRKKLTPAELWARKPRVELSLKWKCAIINEVKRRGFKPDSVDAHIMTKLKVGVVYIWEECFCPTLLT